MNIGEPVREFEAPDPDEEPARLLPEQPQEEPVPVGWR